MPTTIKINQDINDDCGLVMADSTQIHQVVMNIITNAFHAMEENGGELGITLNTVDFGIEDLNKPNIIHESYVCITVSDTGIGIDKTRLDKIFDPYYTTKSIGKGTGLGLSVVHGIVNSYGGDIKVKSEPGKGTTFQIYLPVFKTHIENEEHETFESDPKGTERILLVDDEKVIVKTTKQMLDRLGYNVIALTSSVDALEVFQENPENFDVVLTDLTMPDMTGVQLSQKLRGIRPDIPVIIFTGFSEQINETKALSLGVKGFIMKPVVKSKLAKMIRTTLDGDK